MFCRKCGGEITDGAAFCKYCGESIVKNKTEIIIASHKNSENRKYRLIGIMAVVLVVLGILGVGLKVAGNGYERVIKKYIKSIQNQDGELRFSTLAPDYIDSMIGPGNFYSSEKSFINNLTEECESDYKYFSSCGENIKFKYEILEAQKLSKKDVEYVNKSLRNYGFEKNCVSKAYDVTCQVVASGSEGIEVATRGFLVLRIHGKWYINRGYIGWSDY